MSAIIGVFNVGFHRYWPQFPGLREELDGYRREFECRLEREGVEVVSAGLVDTPESGRQAGDLFASRRVDLIFCDVTTYVQSAFVLPVAQRGKAPMVLVGLQPTAGMEPATATTHDQLAHDSCTSLPEISYALNRAGIPPADIIFGMLHGDERAWTRIQDWVWAAKVRRAVRDARIGFLGHPFEWMLDMNADPTLFHSTFGSHIEMVEMCDFKKCVDAVSAKDVSKKIAEIQSFFCFPDPGVDKIAGKVSQEALEWSARVAAGLDRLVEAFDLDGLAYYYRGVDNNEYEQLIAGMIVGNSLLTARGIPVAGEGDLKNCLAMLILDRLGAGGSFSEFHPADFNGDYVLVGHDGPGHIAISEGKPALRGLSLYHGKYGKGVSVEFKVKNGPITILGCTLNGSGKCKFVVAEGESIPGKIPATGNTNTPGKFSPDVRTFVEDWSKAGPTHHFALGVGHQIPRLEKVGKLLGVDVEVVSTPNKRGC